MELIRVHDKKIGTKYITEDCKYRIWKNHRKANWELAEIVGNGHKNIMSFKYFKDAKQYLEKMIGN